MNTLNKVIGPVAVGLGVLTLAGCSVPSQATNREGNLTEQPKATAKQEEAKPESGFHWAYRNQEDQMGRKQSTATVLSENKLRFGFPYQGEQHASLIVRKSARYGTEVLLAIEKGQFLCRFDGCAVNVRFDTGHIQRISATGPDDHSTTVLFLSNGPGFVSQVKKANVVNIEPTFYQQGSQVLTFNTEGFSWR